MSASNSQPSHLDPAIMSSLDDDPRLKWLASRMAENAGLVRSPANIEKGEALRKQYEHTRILLSHEYFEASMASVAANLAVENDFQLYDSGDEEDFDLEEADITKNRKRKPLVHDADDQNRDASHGIHDLPANFQAGSPSSKQPDTTKSKDSAGLDAEDTRRS